MGRRILIVDDDREVCEMLSAAFSAEGYETFSASSGLRLVSTLLVDRPDLILLDVVLPGMDGLELCRGIRSNQDFNHIHVIFISARKSDEEIRAGMACGAADYFPKPLDMNRLIERVGELLLPEPGDRTGDR